MKKFPLAVSVVCLLLSFTAQAQKYITDKGRITFFSDAVIEDIEATNTVVGSLFTPSSGDIVYLVKIKDFEFDKPLMREHFNEKYMETEKFPKATFQGKITGYNPNISGEQKVRAVGTLSMHGVSKQIDVPGTMVFNSGKITMQSKFKVRLKDYNIKIPTLVWQNIAEEVEVKVDFSYKQL